MKNVAGYDISRLMVGALGTLGVLLEISCKVLPLPAEEVTLVLPATPTPALQQMIYWGNQTVPLTASCYDGNKLLLRLSGTSIQSAVQKIPGDVWPAGNLFWEDLREHRLAFFTKGSLPLWRLSVPQMTPRLKLPGNPIVEWGGALRWFRSELPADTIRTAVNEVGGHATLFRGGNRRGDVFHPLPAPLLKLHCRLKEQFDPHGILNPQKLADQL
jgi:glycolate oxidase FAD binding subunit